MEKTQDGKPTPQGDQVNPETPQAGDAGTQKKESKMVPAEQVQELLADQATRHQADIKALKDEKADIGRLKKTISEQQEKIDELLGAKDDPDLSAAARQKAKDELAKTRKELEAAKGELGTLEENKAALTQERALKAIAAKHEVDPDALNKVIEEKTGISASKASEKMLNFFAEILAESEAAKKDTGYKPDSGVGGGGAGAKIGDMSPAERVKVADRRIREGKKK